MRTSFVYDPKAVGDGQRVRFLLLSSFTLTRIVGLENNALGMTSDFTLCIMYGGNAYYVQNITNTQLPFKSIFYYYY